MEDLWCFNDERVVRAIAESGIPVISAVGHEPDITISDFAADVRASTPSNAAELAVPDRNELYALIAAFKNRIEFGLRKELRHHRERLDAIISRRVLKDPEAFIQDRTVQIDQLSKRLAEVYTAELARKGQKLSTLSAALDAMSPLKVLARGYAMVQTEEGMILKNSTDTVAGEKVKVTLGRGSLTCRVESTEEEQVWKKKI